MVEALTAQSVNFSSIWILFLFILGGESCSYVWSGLSHRAVSSTVTNRDIKSLEHSTN
jgi:hypothetical protein